MGFKTFVAGNALSATDLNNYLMQQTVIVCTSSTHPASPVTGMHIYESDTDNLLYWNGAAWYPPNSRLAGVSRTTASGALSTGMLALMDQVAFTLATTRRVRWRFMLLFDNPSATGETITVNLRRNATGGAVTAADTRIALCRGFATSAATIAGWTAMATGTEVLTAGTYAYGLEMGCSGGTIVMDADAEFPATLDVYDAGWV